MQDFDVCFDPDFVALGTVVKDFRHPDLVIIGESRTEAGDKVEALHQKMCRNKPKIARMSLISAEVAKATNSPDFRDRLKSMGATPVGSSSQELAAHVRNALDRWSRAGKAANFKMEQ